MAERTVQAPYNRAHRIHQRRLDDGRSTSSVSMRAPPLVEYLARCDRVAAGLAWVRHLEQADHEVGRLSRGLGLGLRVTRSRFASLRASQPRYGESRGDRHAGDRGRTSAIIRRRRRLRVARSSSSRPTPSMPATSLSSGTCGRSLRGRTSAAIGSPRYVGEFAVRADLVDHRRGKHSSSAVAGEQRKPRARHRRSGRICGVRGPVA